MRILFVGENWVGSSARSLREALSRIAGLDIHEVNETKPFGLSNHLWRRVARRVWRQRNRRALQLSVLRAATSSRPDVAIFYKGAVIDTGTIVRLKNERVLTVCVYPDYSPLAFGEEHRRAVGLYDLVISTKPYHPEMWQSEYGYQNRCEFVPHGYDSRLHLRTSQPTAPTFDVVLAATWRAEYGEWLATLAAKPQMSRLRFGIAGNGWAKHKANFPTHWVFPGLVTGSAYVDWLRRGSIALGFVQRRVVINGRQQPGDVDTTRTYELAAAHCFFVHQRTAYVQSIYDELSEVPLFNDCAELCQLIMEFMADPPRRLAFASAAQTRAIPAYSIDARAAQVVNLIREHLPGR